MAIEGAQESAFGRGGGLRTLASKCGLAPNNALSLPRITSAALAVTWLPLFMLTLIEGTAFGDSVTVAFLRDHIANGRYLIAMPLLLMLEWTIEHRTSLAIARLRETGMIPQAGRGAFEEDLAAIARLSRSPTVSSILIVLTYLTVATSFAVNRELQFFTWRTGGGTAGGGLSAAGLWELLVATALVRFLFLRALWKLALWSWLLIRLSRMRLEIDPLHPDGRCGLSFLGATQLAFTPLVAALSVQFGCFVAVASRFAGIPPVEFKFVAAAFVLMCIALVLGPLLTFVPSMWLARERSADAFGEWATHAARHISGRLFSSQREPRTGQLNMAEISSMTDASALHDRLMATRTVPITNRQLVVVATASIAPMMLPLAALLPLRDIAQRLAAIFL